MSGLTPCRQPLSPDSPPPLSVRYWHQVSLYSTSCNGGKSTQIEMGHMSVFRPLPLASVAGRMISTDIFDGLEVKRLKYGGSILRPQSLVVR